MGRPRKQQSKSSEEEPQRMPPARSREQKENQMISLAMDLAEKQLREGTASAMVISHYLKLGTTKALLEKEKLERETELLKAKAESIESARRSEELYAQAIAAMRSYNGFEEEVSEEDE